MNILRKSRKSTIKLDKRKVVLLIFTLIMTTFAWITYSKILLPNLKLHINSWNISIYVDNNKNGVAEEIEEADKNAPIAIQPFEVYPGMNLDVMDVIIKNNGETPSEIAYIISGISFLGNDYSIQDNAAAYRASNPGRYCLQKNAYEEYGGIVSYKLINEEGMIPFDFIIEHTKTVDGGAEGYLKVKAVWDAKLDESATEEQINTKNALDGKWGYDITKHIELAANPANGITTAPIEFKLKVNAIGEPRSSRFVLTQDITPENYGDYFDYSIDLNGDGDTTNDWRIFYEGSENIYLIAANYIKNNLIDERAMVKAVDSGKTTYGAKFSTSILNSTSIDQSLINRFMATSISPSENINYKASANLLNQEYWGREDNFLDDSVAVAVSGAPSIEMFAKSWNQKYNGVTGYSKLVPIWDVNKKSYILKIDDDDEKIQINGYENASLYFPTIANDETEAYWLLAPSSKTTESYESENSRMIGIMKNRKCWYRKLYKCCWWRC